MDDNSPVKHYYSIPGMLTGSYINFFLFFQNLKNQIMTTNVWVEQVCTIFTSACFLDKWLQNLDIGANEK
jgi:hypothetical protein